MADYYGETKQKKTPVIRISVVAGIWVVTQFQNQILHLVQDDNSPSIILSAK